MKYLIIIGLVLLGTAYNEAHAIFLIPETQKVPIERLIENLEDEYQQAPPDFLIAWRLGRLHGMAYALKIDSIDVVADKPRTLQGWEYYPPGTGPNPHSTLLKSNDSRENAIAEEHLKAAIKWYETALDLEPGASSVMLGYGWCLQQEGKRREAMAVYRDIIDTEFAKAEAEGANPGGHWRDPPPPTKSITSEALGYLIELLDPSSDGEELLKRQHQLEEVQSRWQDLITPIAIPMTQRQMPADVIDDDIHVSFNLDGSGAQSTWTWIRPDAGWLVHDFNGTGNIISGRDLFGGVTFWLFWRNGYEALRALDDNGDGWLRGTELAGLKIWNDIDSDGNCRRCELTTLEECGIVALSCSYVVTEYSGRTMWMSPDGVRYADGSRRTSYDVQLVPWSEDSVAALSETK